MSLFTKKAHDAKSSILRSLMESRSCEEALTQESFNCCSFSCFHEGLPQRYHPIHIFDLALVLCRMPLPDNPPMLSEIPLSFL